MDEETAELQAEKEQGHVYKYIRQRAEPNLFSLWEFYAAEILDERRMLVLQ